MMCGARYKQYRRVVFAFFPSSVFVHCFLLSFVSPSFTPLVLDNRSKKTPIHPLQRACVQRVCCCICQIPSISNMTSKAGNDLPLAET